MRAAALMRFEVGRAQDNQSLIQQFMSVCRGEAFGQLCTPPHCKLAQNLPFCMRPCVCEVCLCVCGDYCSFIFPRSLGQKAYSVNHLSSSVLCTPFSSSSSSLNLSFYHSINLSLRLHPPPLISPPASTGSFSLSSLQTPNTLLSFPSRCHSPLQSRHGARERFESGKKKERGSKKKKQR